MADPALVIPLRIDGKDALKQLGAINAATANVGTGAKKAGADASAGMGQAAQGAKGYGSELAGIMKAQIALSTVTRVASAIRDSWDDTAKYVQNAAKEFQALRKTMQEVATLKGSANTNQFTLKEARKAQSFHLNPGEYRDFQAQFQNYAGSQIGDIKDGAKLTGAQGENYAGRVAEMMKAHGVNPAVGAELAGSLLENSKGPQDVDALMKRLSTTFQVLQKGRVPLSRALPEISQIMGMGVEAEDAAKMYSIVSPAAAGEEGTSVRAGLRAVNEMKAKGTGDEFGVKSGMSPMESVRAFAANLNDRKQAFVAGGDTEQMAQDKVMKLLTEKQVASDSREQRGLIAGFGRQGVELGGFARYDKVAESVSPSFEADIRKQYEESPKGRADAIENAGAVATAEMGERGDAIEKRRQIAEIELTKGRAFEQFGVGEMARGALESVPVVGALPVRQQKINRQMLARGRAEAGQLYTPADETRAVYSQGATDAAMREILQDIEKNTRKGGMSAPPPGGSGKRQ
jgi:hypothetical protein